MKGLLKTAMVTILAASLCAAPALAGDNSFQERLWNHILSGRECIAVGVESASGYCSGNKYSVGWSCMANDGQMNTWDDYGYEYCTSWNCIELDDSGSCDDSGTTAEMPGTTEELDLGSKPQGEAQNGSEGGSIAVSTYVDEILFLVNSERAAAGLGTLRLNEKACAAANVRAAEIAEVFSHTRPNGQSCFTALAEAGVTSRMSGENIARGQTSSQSVMNDWMNSSGHKDNILGSSFTELGVGTYKDSSGRLCWVQLFIG